MSKKLLFLPESLFEICPDLKKIELYPKFVDFDEFNNLLEIGPEHFLRLQNGTELDEKLFQELGFEKYGNFVNVEEISSKVDGYLSNISSLYNPSEYRDKGFADSAVLKFQWSFIKEFINNTYTKDNLQSYLIDEKEINQNNAVALKLFYETRLKYDFLTSTHSYINKILDYNKYQYNRAVSIKKRPREFNNFIKMILSDMRSYLLKLKYFYQRDLNELKQSLNLLKRHNEKAYELCLELMGVLEVEIRNLDEYIKDVERKRFEIGRNIFSKFLDSLKPKKARVDTKFNIDGSIETGAEIEFKDD